MAIMQNPIEPLFTSSLHYIIGQRKSYGKYNVCVTGHYQMQAWGTMKKFWPWLKSVMVLEVKEHLPRWKLDQSSAQSSLCSFTMNTCAILCSHPSIPYHCMSASVTSQGMVHIQICTSHVWNSTKTTSMKCQPFLGAKPM